MRIMPLKHTYTHSPLPRGLDPRRVGKIGITKRYSDERFMAWSKKRMESLKGEKP